MCNIELCGSSAQNAWMTSDSNVNTALTARCETFVGADWIQSMRNLFLKMRRELHNDRGLQKCGDREAGFSGSFKGHLVRLETSQESRFLG